MREKSSKGLGRLVVLHTGSRTFEELPNVRTIIFNFGPKDLEAIISYKPGE
jgi:hypothetical protein